MDNVSRTKAVWYFCRKNIDTKDNMLFVDMENGIGAVQFFDGIISRSTLGEIGHTTVERNGEANHTNLRRFLRCEKTLFVRRRRCLCLFLSRCIHINAFNNLADSCPYRQVCKDFNYAAFICKRSILQHR